MKTHTILLITLGLASVIASPATQDTISSNQTPCPPLSQDETENKLEELLNKEVVQKDEDVTENTEALLSEIDSVDDTTSNGDQEIDIVLEDDTPMPLEDVPQPQSFNEGFSLTNFMFRNALASKIAGDAVATSKGFVPIPIFRRKQKPRRRFAVRRKFTGYPYRKYHYGYRPYYVFYRPSSLRYY